MKSYSPVNNFISKTSTLWLLFFASVGLMCIAHWMVGHWQILLMDETASPALLRDLLAQMTAAQKQAHITLTSTVEILLPFALGGFFAGVALKFYPRYGFYLALPSLLAIPADLVEGVIQVLALTGSYDLLSLKAVVTPVKIALYAVGFLLALVAYMKWLVLILLSIISGYSSRSKPL